ncbi:MAG: type ISP restriction/modification enzyme [Acidobacteriota bacterium]
MQRLNLKATHKPVRDYYEALQQFSRIGISHEGAVRSAFQSLLESCGSQFGWKLVPEWPMKKSRVRVDGALVDGFNLTHGFWEAKDQHDDLGVEVKRKFAAGYPRNNILFQAPERAILYQDSRQVLDEDITKPEALVQTLKRFVEYTPPAFEEWEEAVAQFQVKVPELAAALVKLIDEERKTNSRFIDAFTGFLELCRQSINPNLSEQAVEEMLIQHLLTERIFRTVFDNADFTRRNVIAAEIEKVIDALTSHSFSREGFLKSLDHFYRAIETTAATIDDFSQKQHFLNAVYEKFFQGFSVKVADTHGIVYTPQPIVNFMVRSVQDILEKEFGKTLSSRDVHILDPFVGTGNFIVRVIQEIKKTALPHKYKRELHCNEVMLLPYYIASMNIEHEYFERTGSYEPFEGICLVDTFELAEGSQTRLSFMTAENTARVERQKRSPIFVIIGNPPYNMGQVNENDNNKNRKYKVMDKRVSETYAKDSKATLLNKLSDPYVKAIRWAADRIGEEGIVALVTNSSFIDQIAFDGMRTHLEQDFDSIYVLDLGGNVRKNPKLSGTTHNVFGIQVGVSINMFVRRRKASNALRPTIHYAALQKDWRREARYRFLEEAKDRSNLVWEIIKADENHTWLTEGMESVFPSFIALASKKGTIKAATDPEAVFKLHSLGVSTNRDEIAYDFNKDQLVSKVSRFADEYNAELSRYAQRKRDTKSIDEFVRYDRLKWSESLKRKLKAGTAFVFRPDKARVSHYRPFTKNYIYYAPHLNDRPGLFSRVFPATINASENCAICVSDIGSRSHWSALITDTVPDLHLCASTDAFQCFSLYTYNEDGTNRKENITDWALQKFRSHYDDSSITKGDIFHYVYALLHHPTYRERYAANLKRELPRIPLAPDFRAFVDAGARLADIHVNYEQQLEYPLEKIETPGAQLDWRVEKMRLTKDKTEIIYNDFLRLSGIPVECSEYRLGNRSALEWLIDQYQVSTDKRSGITNDPNRADDPEYIVRLIGQVITVSLETVKIVRGLPELGVAADP